MKLKFFIPLMGAAFCSFGVIHSVNLGRAALYALIARSQAALETDKATQNADLAAALAPGNPEVYVAKSSVLLTQRNYAAVKTTMDEAIKLLPRDYFLRLEQGRALDIAQDGGGAVAAYYEAARLAPHYADVSWELGNNLIRAGRQTEGLAELKRAALRNPTLWPALIDLSANLLSDPSQAETSLAPQTKEAKFAFARYYALHGRANDAIRFASPLESLTESEKSQLLNDLIIKRHYTAAKAVWKAAEGARFKSGDALIADGSFEYPLLKDERYFGWKLGAGRATFAVDLDTVKPREGKSSLRVRYSGETAIDGIVYQTVPISANTAYRISFAAKVEELVSGGLPVLYIVGIDGAKRETLGKLPLLSGTADWRNFHLDFQTGKFEAVSVELQRNGCDTAQCPIFGNLWLDAFELKPISR
jgi:tetratricopeptide (TPR) repeat protein